VSGARLRLGAPCPTLIFLIDHRIASPIVYFLFLSFFFFLFCGFSFSSLVPRIMGNLCSRSANTTDPFSQPGRVLGSSAQAGQDPNRAPVPSNVRIIQGPGRTLGGSKTDSSEGVGGVGDARSRAAEAAQKRADTLNASAKSGKLSSQLATQKAQTNAQTLDEASRTERAVRDVDRAEHARRWD